MLETPIDKPEGAVPEAADRVTHGCVFAAVQFKVPTPVLAMVTNWLAGLLPGVLAEKVSPLCETPSAADKDLTFSVTFTVCGEPVAPAEFTTMLSVYVPGAKPVAAALMTRVEGAVPEFADNVSHGCVALAFQASVPLPLFVIVTLCEPGLLPPAIAAKPSMFADTFSVVGSVCFGGPPKNKPLTTAFDPARRVTRTITCPARFQTRYWPFSKLLRVRVVEHDTGRAID